MSVLSKLQEARALLEQKMAEAGDSLAASLEVASMKAHVQQLELLAAIEATESRVESIEFRFSGKRFQGGSMPLGALASAANEIKKMLGYAALRSIQGGLDRRRVPKTLYEELDLRLAGLQPGSTRLAITASSERDLLDDGLAKRALERFFAVLHSGVAQEDFLESVLDFGPSSAKRLRELLNMARSNESGLDVTWTFGGDVVDSWAGSRESVERVASALGETEIEDRVLVTYTGIIELLSKNERVQLRTAEGKLIRILFPKRLLDQVSKLRLNQVASLKCEVVESLNRMTSERSTYAELVAVEA